MINGKMLVLLFMSLLSLSRCQGPEPVEVKYVLNFDSPIYPDGSKSEEFIDCSEVFVERHNETTAFMHGAMKFKKKLEKKSILEIVVLKEASGKYEILFSHELCDFCYELGDEDGNYKKHLQNFGLPSECPIEPGSYVINNFVVDVEDIELTSSHVGRYECQLNIYTQTGESCKDRECICSLKMDLMVEEVI